MKTAALSSKCPGEPLELRMWDFLGGLLLTSFNMRGHGPLDLYHWPLIDVIKEKKKKRGKG